MTDNLILLDRQESNTGTLEAEILLGNDVTSLHRVLGDKALARHTADLTLALAELTFEAAQEPSRRDEQTISEK